jgi:hypothetical protein
MKNGVRTEPGVAALDVKVHVFGGSARDKNDQASGEACDPATCASNLARFIKGNVNGSWRRPTDPGHITSPYNTLHIPLSEWAIT